MRRTGQAGVVSAHRGFNPIEQSFPHLGAGDVCFGDAVYGFGHGPVVMTGGDNQVHTGELTIIIRPVMVEERTAGSFQDTDTFTLEIFASVENFGTENIRIFEEIAGACSTANRPSMRRA